MFTLREHARRKIGLATLGAAASIGLGAMHAHAAGTVNWDPGLTPATPSGGSSAGAGDQLNNADGNWSTGAADRALLSNDDAHFGTIGGTVTNTGAPTAMNSLTFDVGGYNISGGSILLSAPANSTLLTQVTGNNTINSTLTLGNQGNSGTGEMNIASGTLTLGNVTMGNYGLYRKTGNGNLNITGTISPTNAGYTNYNIEVAAGSVRLSGTNFFGTTTGNANGFATAITAGASMGGNAKVVTPIDVPWNINGTLAPGANPVGSTSGATGTFEIAGAFQTHTADVTFGSTSILALDLVSPDSAPGVFDGTHDVFKMTAGAYGGFLHFDASSKIIVSGTPGVGTYHIVQMVGSAAAGNDQNNFVPIVDNGLSVDLVNSTPGFNYQVVDLGNAGIDLVVTASGVPEPTSIALLGIGTGLLMVRKRRRSET